MTRKTYFLLFPAFILLFCSCSNEFDGKDGVKTVYFQNSEIIKQIVEYKNGKRIGELKEFYRNGKLKTKQNYQNDTLNDSAFYYHENGNLQSFQYLKNFKKEGVWKKFNEQGKLYEEINFKDGDLDGYWIKYTYRTGRLLQRLSYKNGMKEGKHEFYYNNGKPKAVAFFHYNNPCIGTEEWDEAGNKINNDFKITCREENKLLLENRLMYYIKLENPKPDDKVWTISDNDPENYVTPVYVLRKINDEFLMDYKVGVGGFVMEKVKLAAHRKTDMGNTFVKTYTVTVSANNF